MNGFGDGILETQVLLFCTIPSFILYLTRYQIIKPRSLLIHVTSLSFLQNTFFCYFFFFFVHTKSNVISLFTAISNIYDSLTSCIKSTKHVSSIPTHYLDSTECSAHYSRIVVTSIGTYTSLSTLVSSGLDVSSPKSQYQGKLQFNC